MPADSSGLVTAALFERDWRAERYPARIEAGSDAEAASVDYQCWCAIAEWLESARFESFQGGAEPERDGAPIISWPALELAADSALVSVTAKLDKLERTGGTEPEKLGALRQRRSCLWTIHRKVQLRRQSIDTINAEFSKFRKQDIAA